MRMPNLEPFRLPGRMERLKTLRIGSQSLAIGPLGDFRFLLLDLDRHRSRRREGCGKLRDRFAGRRLCLPRKQSGDGRRRLACIEVHPRRSHPFRLDSNDRPGDVVVGYVTARDGLCPGKTG